MAAPTNAFRRPRPAARPSRRRRRGRQAPSCSTGPQAHVRGRPREAGSMGPRMGSPEQHDDETRRQRVNRELIELLNELRVALPGVQVLFAFLLAVPFSNGWSKVTAFQKNVFFVTLVSTSVSTACFIVPTAYHRLNFRMREKERILLSSNKFAIAGIMFLAVSMIGVIVLITDVIYSETAAVVTGLSAFVLFGGLWLALPLLRRDEP